MPPTDSSNSECQVIIEDCSSLSVEGNPLRAVNRKTEKLAGAEILVMEEEKVLQITNCRPKSSDPLRFSLQKFIFFNKHVSQGKLGLKFLESRWNPREKLVLIKSADVELIKEVNAGILASQGQKPRERGTPAASPTKYSPFLKKTKGAVSTPATSRGSSVDGIPVGRFGFGTGTPKPLREIRSPQLNLDDSRSMGVNSGRSVFSTDSLSDEQRLVIDAVLKGESIFLTGGGGTGKSFLLKKLIGLLPAHSTAVTASTGIAACHIGGTTLHQFVGLGRDAVLQPTLARLRKNPDRLDVLTKTKILIIDEISLIDAKLFELVSEVLASVRKCMRPFGGLQLVLAGDFLQLPPVGDKQEVKFCFESKLWKKAVKKSVHLTQIFRQTNDSAFASLLNEIRLGRCSDETAKILLSRVTTNSGGLQLLPLNREVAEVNEKQLSVLPSDADRQTFSAIDSVYDPGAVGPGGLDGLCPVKANVRLVVGARVMLVATISVTDKLVNGAVGTLIRFSKTPSMPFVQFSNDQPPIAIGMHEWVFKQNGKEIARRRQIPLALAWGVSIHKSQGMTLDTCQVSLARIFEAGQAYVALSRCKSLEGLQLIGEVTVRSIQKAIRANPVCLDFYNQHSPKGLIN